VADDEEDPPWVIKIHGAAELPDALSIIERAVDSPSQVVVVQIGRRAINPTGLGRLTELALDVGVELRITGLEE
jgi:hypothetical protein